MLLNVPFILESLSGEASMIPGQSLSFSFEDWTLNLKKEPDSYEPYTFSLTGHKVNTAESWSRRYTNMEKAFLHILNRFNENAVIEDKYHSLTDVVNFFSAGTAKDTTAGPYSMDLQTFLSYFDFDYGIVSPGGKYEDKIRSELIEDGKLTGGQAEKDLICLLDCQGVYLGDIEKERYPIESASVQKIIDRMNIYILEFENEFFDALAERDIDAESMSLEDMILKCKELGVGTGEVCYTLAEAVNAPETIFIKEALAKELGTQSRKEPLADRILSASMRAKQPQDRSDPVLEQGK